MKIDNWPLDRIMRLPDWCFGRRWFVGAYQGGIAGAIHLNISDEELPDKFVTWGILFSCRAPSMLEALRCTIRLGSRIPVDAAEALTLETLFKGISTHTILYEFYFNQNGIDWLPIERQIVESGGKRLVIVTQGDAVINYESTVAVQISALPKEVPDWLISGQGKNLY